MCEGLSLRLSELPDLEIVAGTTSAGDAEQLVREHRPEVVVLDLDLDRGVRELIGRIHAMPSRPSVVVLTEEDPGSVAEALCHGASACVLREAPLQDLISAIQWVRNGEMWISPSLLSDLLIDERQRRDRGYEQSLSGLTDREVAVLELLVQGHSYREVARVLDIAVNTVRTHTRNIQVKLHVQSNLAAVSVALERGIRPC